jgi:hypothetical protein
LAPGHQDRSIPAMLYNGSPLSIFTEVPHDHKETLFTLSGSLVAASVVNSRFFCPSLILLDSRIYFKSSLLLAAFSSSSGIGDAGQDHIVSPI